MFFTVVHFWVNTSQNRLQLYAPQYAPFNKAAFTHEKI